MSFTIYCTAVLLCLFMLDLLLHVNIQSTKYYAYIIFSSCICGIMYVFNWSKWLYCLQHSVCLAMYGVMHARSVPFSSQQSATAHQSRVLSQSDVSALVLCCIFASHIFQLRRAIWLFHLQLFPHSSLLIKNNGLYLSPPGKRRVKLLSMKRTPAVMSCFL